MSPNRRTLLGEPDPLADLHNDLLRRRAELPQLHTEASRLRDDPGRLLRSLSLLDADDQALAEVAERSYGHQGGFAKIVLREGGGYRIRLHVWHRRDGRLIGDSDPHGHRWEFASWVLVGGLCETTYAEAADGGMQYRRHDYARDPSGVGFLTPNGLTTLRVVDRTRRSAGTVYQATRRVVHTVAPVGQDLVASLVLQGPRKLAPTPVYRPPGEESVHVEYPLPPSELRELIADVADAI